MSSGKNLGPSRGLDETAVADDRTLALATPGLTTDKLELLVGYQRRLLDALGLLGEGGKPLTAIGRHAAASAPERLAQAEQDARAGLSQADQKELSRLIALAADFCAKRWTLRQLEQKRAAAPPPRSEAEQEVQKKLETEIARLSSMDAFTRRHGRPAVELLLEREAELLALHQAVQHLYRG